MTLYQTLLKHYYRYRIKKAVGDMFWRALEQTGMPELDMKAMYEDIVAKNNWRIAPAQAEDRGEAVIH